MGQVVVGIVFVENEVVFVFGVIVLEDVAVIYAVLFVVLVVLTLLAKQKLVEF